MPKIKTMEIVCDDPRIGSFTYKDEPDGCLIGGEPTPSESQAHLFHQAVLVVQGFMNASPASRRRIIEAVNLEQVQ